MPLIGIDTYNIDYYILPTNDPKTITLLDNSHYLSLPEKPLINVILPGFTGSVQFPYIPGGLITIDSDSLDLTENTDYDYTADLPDGVYQITMKVCPYDQLYNKKCYLKTTKFDEQFQQLLLCITPDCCEDQRKLKDEIVDIDILIQSAKAEVNLCNVEKGTLKYQVAVKKLQNLNKKLNCSV